MNFNLTTRKLDNVTIFDLFGRFTAGVPVDLFRNILQAEVDDGARYVVINLGKVSFVDSFALGQLVSAKVSLHQQDGNAVLLGLTARTTELLQMTKLLTVFESFADEAKSVAAAAGHPKIASIAAHPSLFVDHDIQVVGRVAGIAASDDREQNLYQIDDGTGTLHVLSGKSGAPREGARVVVKGRLVPSITFMEKDYVTALRETERRA